MPGQSAEDFLSEVSSPHEAATPPQDPEAFLSGVDSPLDSAPAPPSVGAGQQMSGPLRYPALAASALVHGGATTLGLPGDLESLILRGTNALGVTHEDPGNTLFPQSAKLLALARGAGLTDQSNLIPGYGSDPGAERYVAAGASGLGSSIPMLAMGGGVVPTLASGTLGALAGQGARDLLPGVPGAPLAAGLLAGTGAAGAAKLIAGNPFQRVARSLGSSTTYEQAGDVLQQEARDWLTKTMPARQAQAWGPVDRAIPPGAPVPLTNFQQALSDINSQGGNLKAVAGVLSKSLPKQLSDALQNKTMVGLGIPPSWADARTIRTMLGDAMSDPALTRDIGQQNLAKLYGSISQDLRGTASANGALDLFDNANAVSTQAHDFAAGLSKIVAGAKESSADPQAGALASRLLSRGRLGGAELAGLRAELPNGVDEMAAAHLTNAPGAWAKLSPEGKIALVPDAAQRASLDAASAATRSGGPVSHTLQSLVGGGAGYAMGALGEYMLGHPTNSLLGPAIGELAGLAGPYLMHGGLGLLRHPGRMAVPATGAIGALGLPSPPPGQGSP